MPGFGFGASAVARRRLPLVPDGLAPLVLAPLSIAENSAPGTTIGTVEGGTAGAALALVDDAGDRVALSGRRLVVGATPIDFEAGATFTLTLRQRRSGLADREQAFTVTVLNVFEQPDLQPLALSAVAFTAGTPATGTITGATEGSTIVATGLPPGLTVDGPARRWSFDGSAGSAATPTLTETLADSANSPRATVIAVTIAPAAPPASVAAPALVTAAAAPDDPRVGIAATGTPATFAEADAVAHAVYRVDDGARLADGSSYTPGPADAGKVLEFRSTATGAGGTTISRAYAPATAQFDSLADADNSSILAHTGAHGATWAKNGLASYAGDGIIVGNRLGRGASANLMVYGFAPSGPAYVVEATYTIGAAAVAGGAISFRASSSAATFYAFGLTSTSNWGMTKRVGNAVRTSDITGVTPYDQAPFAGNAFTASSASLAPLVRIAANTSYAVAIHVWDEGGAVQFAIYVNGCLVIRAQDADATRLTAPGVVGWYDTQAAAVTATAGNKVSNMRVHPGRIANAERIDLNPMQPIAPGGSLDLRGVARAYAASDDGTYARAVGGWCEGGTTDVKVRVEKAVGGDPVVDWVTPTGLTIAGPRWFGTLDLPRSRPTANSAGVAWDVLRFRHYRGGTLVRTGTSARFGNGIAMTAIGSSIAAVWANVDGGPHGMASPLTTAGGATYPAAGLVPDANSAILPRYSGTYYFTSAASSDLAVIAERTPPDLALYGWRIAYNGAVGANVFARALQAEFGGLIFVVAGGVGGSSISGASTGSGWIDTSLNIAGWRAQVVAMGGVNLVSADFGINEARQQAAGGGVLTRADMLARWTALLTQVRAIAGLASVPIVIKGSPSDTSTAASNASGANNPGNNRRARQAEIAAAAYDAATYRGPPQFDVQRYDGLHPHVTAAGGTQLVAARLAEACVAILKGQAPGRLQVTGAAKVSNTRTRVTIGGAIQDPLAARDGMPGWEIATGGDLDAGVLAVSGAVYEGTAAGVASYLVTHAGTGGAAYRAGYGEAPGQGTAGVSSPDAVSLRDTRPAYPRAVEQTAGGIPVIG